MKSDEITHGSKSRKARRELRILHNAKGQRRDYPDPFKERLTLGKENLLRISVRSKLMVMLERSEWV